MDEVKVQIKLNGPILVSGLTQLHDAAGQPIPVTAPVVALCRCGHSEKKPFCDGAHKRVQFQG